MDIGLLSKYREIKLVPDGTLFGKDNRLIKKGNCPTCLHKLYLTRKGDAIYCRSKLCPDKYYIKLKT